MDSAEALPMEERESDLGNSFSKSVSAKQKSQQEEPTAGSDSSLSCEQNSDEIQYVKEESDSDQETIEGKGKPTLSYIALISMAILSSPAQRMLLSEIYSWIAKNYPYYKQKDRSWRNSIRHNLSLNECFVKAGRSENGKGNYWTIHPANTIDFGQGDFRRRRARRRVRQCNEELERLRSGLLGMPDSNSSSKNSEDLTTSGDYYVPMTSTWAPKSVLAAIFGPDVVLSAEEKSCMKRKRHYHRATASHVNSDHTNMTSCIFQSNNCLARAQVGTISISDEEAQFMGLPPQSASANQSQQTHHAHSNIWPSYHGVPGVGQYGTTSSNHFYES